MNSMLMELGHLYGYQNEKMTSKSFRIVSKWNNTFVKNYGIYATITGTDILLLIEKEEYSCIFYNLTSNKYVSISNIWLFDLKAI